ncbi:MAG: peroxiredoxin family protein [Gammaproteobacteria bacterium]|nr:peroxiredoxin family protein [Gammaproteobacteria bacterium]
MINLSAGDNAPDFQATDLNGTTIQLSSYAGKKTLLCFFRFASCPLCTVRFTQLLQKYPEYKESGLEIIAVFESSPDYIRKYISHNNQIPFPVIGDLEGRIYKLYNVKKSFLGMMLGMFRIFKMIKGMSTPGFKMGKPDGSVHRVPADFLIDPLLTIEKSYYGSDIGDHIPLKSIDDFISNKTINI